MLALFVGAEQVLSFDPNIQGQIILDDGKIVLGARAAYEVCATNLFHEMGHFVEIDTRRIKRYGWGLRCKTRVKVMGEYYDEPTTHQMTDREIRVMAFQANLCKHFNITPDLDDMANVLRHMPDSTFVPMKDGSKPDYSKFDSRHIQASQKAWVKDQILKAMEVYTMNVFMEEWTKRIKMLKRRK